MVLDRGGTYEVLDGQVRSEILKDLGETTIPCQVFKEKQPS